MRNPPYITLDDLLGFIQTSLAKQGLNDSADADRVDPKLFDAVYKLAENTVHSYIENRYRVPVADPVPGTVWISVLTFCAEAVWMRRGFAGDANPFTKAAGTQREQLAKIRAGKEDLGGGVPHIDNGGVVAEDRSAVAWPGVIM